jgi:ketosteroid isomerase-like protein
MHGEIDGKPLDLITTETMVLTREPEGWRIRHIHWSSARSDEQMG